VNMVGNKVLTLNFEFVFFPYFIISVFVFVSMIMGSQGDELFVYWVKACIW
jgi:hypothetical protein